MRVFALLFLAGCLPPDLRDGDRFFLEHEGAVLPVWVRGNSDSDTTVVFLHGGPGLSSLTYATNPAHEVLQERYRMVYWDQRGSGAAQGNAVPETMSLEQFVDDTDALIDLVRWRYETDRVFLVGKSWGGALGTAYLLDPDRQAKIHGWIEVDGTHNWEDALSIAVDYMKGYAADEVSSGNDIDFWTDAQAFYQTHGDEREFALLALASQSPSTRWS